MFAKIGVEGKSEIAARYVADAEGRANEGWTVHLLFCQIYLNFDQVVFGTFLKDGQRRGLV